MKSTFYWPNVSVGFCKVFNDFQEHFKTSLHCESDLDYVVIWIQYIFNSMWCSHKHIVFERDFFKSVLEFKLHIVSKKAIYLHRSMIIFFFTILSYWPLEQVSHFKHILNFCAIFHINHIKMCRYMYVTLGKSAKFWNEDKNEIILNFAWLHLRDSPVLKYHKKFYDIILLLLLIKRIVYWELSRNQCKIFVYDHHHHRIFSWNSVSSGDMHCVQSMLHVFGLWLQFCTRRQLHDSFYNYKHYLTLWRLNLKKGGRTLCLSFMMMFKWMNKQPIIQKCWNLCRHYQDIYEWISP